MAAASTGAIDFHAHHVPRSITTVGTDEQDWFGIRMRLTEDGRLEHTHSGRTRRLPWKNFRATPEDRLEDMDELGVAMQALSLSPSLCQYGTDPATATAMAREVNDDLADICARWPDRFLGLANLPLQDVDAAVAEVIRVSELGLTGIGIHTHVNGRNWDEEALFPVLEAAESTGAIVFIHSAETRVVPLQPRHSLRNTIGNPWEGTIAVGSLIHGGVLDRLPDLRIVLAHGGGYTSFAVGRMDHAWHAREEARGSQRPPSDYLKRFYFDSLTHSDPALVYLAQTVGIDNVVLGSDYPADMASGDPVGHVRGIEHFSEEDVEKVLAGNARKLLGD